MEVVILGCGPSGLVAASAAISIGHSVTMISDKLEPSKIYGCQYLHAPIPGYEDVPKTRVSYSLIGTMDQYRRKVYGDVWEGNVSPEDFIGEHDAWDLRETYSRMWERMIFHNDYAIRQITWHFENGDVPVRILNPDRIISTIPANALCEGGHTFREQVIYAVGDREPDMPSFDAVMCNGTDDMAWYRSSNVFGYQTYEWPGLGYHPPDAVRVTKPLSTDCNCNPDVIRVGRYGKWDKNVLVHEVYEKVLEALN